MNKDLILALCGALGALMYGFPLFIAAMRAVPPTKYAWASLVFSVTVGALFAPILVPTMSDRFPWLTPSGPFPLAVGIGLAINPIAPILVKKLTGWADSYTIGPTK